VRFGARFDRRSIEARVLILQGAGWLTLLVLVGTTAWTSSRQLSYVAATREQQLANVVAHQLDQMIANDLARVQGLSGAPRLVLDDEELAPERAALGEAFHTATLIESIRLIDRAGHVLLQEPRAAPAAPVDADRVQEAFGVGRLRAAVVSEAPLRAEILVPLRDHTGEIRVLAGVMLNAHARSVKELLTAADAQLLSSTAAVADAAQVALSVAPWVVVASHAAPREHASPWRTLAWSLPVSLVLGLLFAWGTARSVRRPALALTAAAERMAGGDLDTPLPLVPDGDEMGRLARVLERLRLALHRDAWRQQTLRKVISAQEDERRRIARELHDDTAQALAAVGVSLEAALDEMPVTPARGRLESLKRLVNQSLADLHHVIYDLRPSILDDLGLAAAIRWLADEHLRRTGVAVKVECYGIDERLPSDIETAVFRVVQEALSNIERHSEADAVLAQVSLERGTLAVEIEDDGKGFEPEKVGVTTGSARGLGLQGMRERVELMGGSFSLSSSPGRGTRIAITVPL
jgi:signal transduction histidine kinase